MPYHWVGMLILSGQRIIGPLSNVIVLNALIVDWWCLLGSKWERERERGKENEKIRDILQRKNRKNQERNWTVPKKTVLIHGIIQNIQAKSPQVRLSLQIISMIAIIRIAEKSTTFHVRMNNASSLHILTHAGRHWKLRHTHTHTQNIGGVQKVVLEIQKSPLPRHFEHTQNPLPGFYWLWQASCSAAVGPSQCAR